MVGERDPPKFEPPFAGHAVAPKGPFGCSPCLAGADTSSPENTSSKGFTYGLGVIDQFHLVSLVCSVSNVLLVLQLLLSCIYATQIHTFFKKGLVGLTASNAIHLTDYDPPVVCNHQLAVNVDQLGKQSAMQFAMRPQPAERDVVLPVLPHWVERGGGERREPISGTGVPPHRNPASLQRGLTPTVNRFSR